MRMTSSDLKSETGPLWNGRWARVQLSARIRASAETADSAFIEAAWKRVEAGGAAEKRRWILTRAAARDVS